MVKYLDAMEVDESSGFSKDAVLKLIEEKDRIERDIASFVAVLEQNSNIGMNGPLIDAEGFPRSDIDVYQKIEQGLHAIHAQVRESGDLPNWNEDVRGGDSFVRINFVAPGSPAAEAGLQVEDQFVEFGTLNANNYTSLQDVAQIVQNSVNTEIPIKVKRKTQFLRLRLTPKTWSGRGLLGCNIVPLENVER
ncbi:hypothetical protein B566_EDAN014389 [Ephemera danica]|nr:hypothetical protein B566_EDAN014389 [Ephemera danica]